MKWFPKTPELAAFKSPRLSFELFAERHLDFVQENVAKWPVAQWLSSLPHPYPADGAKVYLERCQEAFAEQRELHFIVSDRETGDLLGNIGLNQTDRPDEAWEIGYWFAPQSWGRGVASEAALHVLQFGFQFMEIKAAYTGVFAQNFASKRVLEKSGFETWVAGSIQSNHSGEVAAFHSGQTRAEFQDFLFSGGCAFQPQLERQVPVLWVVAAALFNEDDQVLVAQRPAGKSLEGLWEFPGGKMELNEGPEAALVRELKEELGIDVGFGCLAPLTFASHAYPKFHLMMPLYAIRKWQGELQGKEGQAIKWVSKEELRTLPMPPADDPLVPVVLDWM